MDFILVLLYNHLFAGTVNCVRFNEESTLVLSGAIDCSVRIWDLKSRKNEPVQVTS